MPQDFTIPDEPIPDPENESIGLYLPVIPKDAPKALHTLAQNMSELLTSIHLQRGPEYAMWCGSLITLQQNISEMESIICQKIPFGDITHQIGHTLSEAAQHTLFRISNVLAEKPEFAGIRDDLNMMINRLNKDWHMKENKDE